MSRPPSAARQSASPMPTRPGSAQPRAVARPASALARPAAALAPRPSSALPRAQLQRPISAMGRPIASDLQAGPAHRPPQKDVIRPSSALGLNRAGLPDFRAPPAQCPKTFDRSGYAEWEAGAKGNRAEDLVEMIHTLERAPLEERKRPGQMKHHIKRLQPKLDEVNEVLEALPEADKTKTEVLEARKDLYRALEECVPLAYIPPPDYEEEQAAKLAEWEQSLGGEKKKKEPKKKADPVDEGGVIDPRAGRLDVAMLTQFREAEALVQQIHDTKEAERRARIGGSFDPLTPAEREEKNRREIEALMDNMAYGKIKKKKPKQERPKRHVDSESEGSESSEEDEKHQLLLELLKGPKPKAGKPTEMEKLQIAVREGRKQEKLKKQYREEETEFLRDLGLIPGEDDYMYGLGIFDTTNPKKPRKKPWQTGVDRRRAVELMLREKRKQLLHQPIRSAHVWMRQNAPIDGPKKGQGHDWVRVECRLFPEGTVELLQRMPKVQKIITLQECSTQARSDTGDVSYDERYEASLKHKRNRERLERRLEVIDEEVQKLSKNFSEEAFDREKQLRQERREAQMELEETTSSSHIDNKVQAVRFNFRYEEIRYDDSRLHTALLRPPSAHTKKSSPEGEFVLIPHSNDAVIEVVAEEAGRDGGMDEIVLRAETVTEKADWLQAFRPFLFENQVKPSPWSADEIPAVASTHRESPSRVSHPPAAAPKSGIAGVFESLERGMERLKLYGRHFAVSSSHRLGRLKDGTTRAQRSTSTASLFSRSLSPFRSFSPTRLAQRFRGSKDHFARGKRRKNSNASSSEEEEDYSTGKPVLVKVHKQPSTHEAREAIPSTIDPPIVVTRSSANDSPAPNRGRIAPETALEKRGAVFVDTPIRPASALRRPASALRSRMPPPADALVVTPLCGTPTSASTDNVGKDNVGGLFQAMSPLRLLRRGRTSASHAGTGRLLPADEDSYYNHRHADRPASPSTRRPTEHYSISDARYSRSQSPVRRGLPPSSSARPRSAVVSKAVVIDAPIRPVSAFRRGAPQTLAGTSEGVTAAAADEPSGNAENAAPAGNGKPPRPPRPADTSTASTTDSPVRASQVPPRERVTYQPLTTRLGGAGNGSSGTSAVRPKGPSLARPRAAAAK